jgi:lipopolysaccharide assembly outer membrane protein LptD (OstA)
VRWMEGLGWILLAALFSSVSTFPAGAQTVSYSEKFLINASSASSWSAGNVNIVQLQGPVIITMDDVKCSADQAVVWLTPSADGLLAEQQADIVLLGHAKLAAHENHLTRTAGTLLVNTVVRGTIELTVASKLSEDRSQSALYMQAQAVRDAGNSPSADSSANQGPAAPITTTSVPPSPAPGGTNASGVVQPTSTKGGAITFGAKLIQETEAHDGTRMLILSGGVTITQASANGDFLGLLARDVVLFSDEPAGRSASTSPSDVGHLFAPSGAYLEGDVRMDFVPALAKEPEQRLTADRVYFDFKTQRAILTSVVFHAIDPTSQVPITVRAAVMQRLSHAEFVAKNAQFTTSKFAVPTYSIGASYAYIHQEPQDNEYFNVESKDDTLHVFGIPVFFWPALSGTINTKPFPLRTFSTGNSSRNGFTVNSDWGLFETLGETPPKDLDISYRLDYYSERGAGGGFDGNYKGGFITDSADPWDFQGDFKSYIMSDKGIDQLGGLRTDVDPPTELRGRFLWEHEHFLPDDWQVQVRVGYVSDPTFDEEYYQSDFDNTLPYDAEFYIKRQHDTEVLTFLVNTDTTDFTTNADRQQEQFDVARLPEITYQRIGDSFLDDNLTLYSNTSGAVLKFDRSNFTLEEQGFYPGLSPGLPSDGFTGTTGSIVYRGDTRQEVDWPIAIGQLKVVPYVMGEVTAYSDSPDQDEQTRLYGGVGARITTTFWRVDDSVDSDLFDLHRIRHVIQPEINIFSSATSVDESQVYIFDPEVDGINDITAAQFALHQHWETMRGGPGRWQSVDILDVNVEGDFYPHSIPQSLLTPQSFRGLFFPSEPQTSVPRQAVNADATWHIGDDTALISDIQWNLDKRETAIAEAGLAINRGSRLSYYVGDAYIQDLESQVFSFNANYNLTSKYSINLNQALDFGVSRAAVTYLTVTRRFDAFAFSVSVYHDDINKISGFNVNLIPAGQPGFTAPWRAND